MAQKYDQFYNIATGAAKVLCPGQRYENVELLNREKGIKISEKEKDGLNYIITFIGASNIIRTQIYKGENKKTELTHKLGSVSIAVLVHAIRASLSSVNDSPFAKLLG